MSNKILVVDDETEIADLIEVYLKNENYTVIKLSSLPYIEGIVLGGSRARGTHTEDSDIDIGIYYNQESFDLTAINQIATELDDENRNNLVVPPLIVNCFHNIF